MTKKKIIIKKKKSNITTKQYVQFLENIKTNIAQAQLKAATSISKELALLYWNIGKLVSEKINSQDWGAKIIDQLAQDLGKAFPGVSGFSRSNIYYMMAFYETYHNYPTAAGQLDELPIFSIPWGHNIILITQIKALSQRLWYAQKTIENGWSRTILEMQIESNLFERSGKAITNFHNTLPKPDSDLAQQTLKDPYNFDFLALHEEHLERDMEEGLINNVSKLLLEMGKGFALVGKQYHLEVDDQDYFIDLLFYHTKLKCYFVVELKSRKFDVKDLGQLSFYLSVVDDLVRDKDDKPTLGLLLCKTKKKITAEYALRNMNRPIGIAEYKTKIINELSKDMKSKLPTIAEIESELKKSDLLQKAKKRNMKKVISKAIKKIKK